MTGGSTIKVKVCGIRTAAAAEAASNGGAAFIGFIFFNKSRRFVEPATAKNIAQIIPSTVKKVGVFVDETGDTINHIADFVGLDYVQLHGNETADFAAALERPIIKAWRFGDNFDVQSANNFPCEIILLDSFVKGQAGGTGQLFNWTAAAMLTQHLTKPLLIAGGISIDNVRTAVEMFRPFGVDVSGSLEVDGVKSVELIERFLRTVNRLEEIDDT